MKWSIAILIVLGCLLAATGCTTAGTKGDPASGDANSAAPYAKYLRDAGDALYERGMRKYGQMDYRGATADHTAALTFSPDRFEFYISRGHAKAEFDFEASVEDYTHAIRLNPNAAHAFRGRAYAKQKNGDAAGALADCNQSIKIDPTIEHTYFVRYCAKKDLGDSVGAQADLKKYEELRPKR